MADAVACEAEFFSTHVESLREALSTVDVNDDEARVEVEIKASKVHWSELASTYVTAAESRSVESSSSSTSALERMSEVETMEEWNERVAEDNVVLFRSLQARYPGGFFVDDNDVGPDHMQKLPPWMFGKDGKVIHVELKLSSEKPFAEGAQAQLFNAHWVSPDGKRFDRLVLKVFKEGTSLRDLQRLLPPTMLNDKSIQDKGCLNIGCCNEIVGARLLKCDGRFAFVMLRAWGDLRKLMDVRMLHVNNQGAPIPNDKAAWCMLNIARGMQSLHAKGIVHRDLKVANVLIFDVVKWSEFDPFHLNPPKFGCYVADYECSVGVVGTRFWRAPEILLAVKNSNVYQMPEIFSKEADVYSFGMVCYEILMGRIPFEEFCGNDYDGVIGGARPILPTHTSSEIMDMVKRCWHKDPALRPTFDQIVEILVPLHIELIKAWNHNIRKELSSKRGCFPKSNETLGKSSKWAFCSNTCWH